MSGDTDQNPQSMSVNLTNFLFGNVNEKWELEDFGEEEERSAIGRLAHCHVDEIDTTVRSMTHSDGSSDNANAEGKNNGSGNAVVSQETPEDTLIKPLPYAEDFSTIEEAVDLNADDLQNAAAMESGEGGENRDDDYDDYDDEVIKKENVDLDASVPTPASQSGRASYKTESPCIQSDMAVTDEKPYSQASSNAAPVEIAFVPTPEVDPNYPMRHIMPPELEGIDIRTFFPDYDPLKTPRWSKLFKPSRPLGHYSNELVSPTASISPQMTVAKALRLTPIDDLNAYAEQLHFEFLKLGHKPPPHLIDMDDADRMMLESSSDEEGFTSAKARQNPNYKNKLKRKKRKKRKRRRGQAQGDEEEEPEDKTEVNAKKRRASFRHGPAELWYDMVGLPPNYDILRWKPKPVSSSNADAHTSSAERNEELADEEGDETDLDKIQGKSVAQSQDSPYWIMSWDECESTLQPPRECLLPINQRDFTEDVIWDVELSRDSVMERNRQRAAYAGWTPHSNIRTISHFQDRYHGDYPGIYPPAGGSSGNNPGPGQNGASSIEGQGTNNGSNGGIASGSSGSITGDVKTEGFVSLFPVDNYELMYSNWEDKIMWDPEINIPPPCVLSLDKTDENLILEVPVDPHLRSGQDIDAGIDGNGQGGKEKEKTPRKSRLVLGKAGLLKEAIAEDEEPTEEETQVLPTKDRFNLSNDDYYYPRHSVAGQQGSRGVIGSINTGPLVGPGPLQHSTPAMELKPCYFPTHMKPVKLRQFHRPPLKRYTRGPMSMYQTQVPVLNLTKNIQKRAKHREEERARCGGGDIFFMRTPNDLTGCDGELVLLEYSEEFPSLMSLIGMANKMRNYWKRPSAKEISSGPPDLPYGELIPITQSPFLGQLRTGQCLQTIENNMFRAPIYSHRSPPTDFLLIRTRNSIYIRMVPNTYTVGQTLPLMEVPGPNSKKANNFIRDFVQAYIYRLFWRSKDEPRRIKMDDVRRAFPTHSESSMRKRLKLCADFKRTGQDASWWVLRQDFRLASEEELRTMVTPEDCAAYYSMTTAEQRLKDAGYGEKYMFTPEGDDDDDDEKDSQVKMEDEVRCAPWNTTNAYLAAVRGKCFLDLNGPADPSGIGEAFSYVKLPAKPGALQNKDGAGGNTGPQPKRTVTGTDADLRRLQLQEAKDMCRSFGLLEKDLENLGRWDIVDMVRFVSTRKAKEGEELDLAKFARGNRLSTQEQHDRYKEECQRIFDLQNRVLASDEVLSTDDNSDDSDDSDIEEMGKNIESVLDNKMTSQELGRSQEEEERKRLQRAIAAGESLDGKKRGGFGGAAAAACGGGGADHQSSGGPSASAGAGGGAGNGPRRILRITRTFMNEEGKAYTRTEVVRTPGVIDIYLKIRQTKEESFIRQFAGSDEQQKEELRREKRRLQDQLRRLRKMEQAQQRAAEGGGGGGDGSGGGSGGMGSSSRSGQAPARKKVKKPLTPAQLKMRCGACGQIGHMRTNRECPVYMQTSGKSASRPPKERRGGGGGGGGGTLTSSLDLHNTNSTDHLDDSREDADDGAKIFQAAKVEDSGGESRDGGDSRPHLKMTIKRVDTGGPPSGGGPPATPTSIKKKAIGGGASAKKSVGMSGGVSGGHDAGSRTKGGRQLSQASSTPSEKTADYLQKPKQSSHRRRVDPLVALTSVLEEIFNTIYKMEGSEFFYYPVSDKTAPTYRDIVQKPMDLQTIRSRLQAHEYTTREDFICDLKLVRDNSALFNGPSSTLTESANRMFEKCLTMMAVKEEKLMRLEKAINPLLDEDDFVGLAYILEQAIERMRTVENSWPFHHPVDGKRYKDYYTRIQSPMDLKTLERRVKERRYRSRDEFLSDVELIVNNCIIYNRETSPLTTTAKKMMTVCRECLREHEDTLASLEANIMNRLDDTFTCSDSNAGKSAIGALENSPQALLETAGGGGGEWEDDLQLSSEDESSSPTRSSPMKLSSPEKTIVKEEFEGMTLDLSRTSDFLKDVGEKMNVSSDGHNLADDLALSEDEDEEIDVEGLATVKTEEEELETEGGVSPKPKLMRLDESSMDEFLEMEEEEEDEEVDVENFDEPNPDGTEDDDDGTDGEDVDGNGKVSFFLGGDEEDSNI